MESSPESDVIYMGGKIVLPLPKVVEGFDIVNDSNVYTFFKNEAKTIILGREHAGNPPQGSSSVETNGVYYACPVVSKLHAEFSFKDDKLFIADAGSTHGTWKSLPNGVQMKIGDVPSIVNDGDRYVFGKVLEKGGIVHQPITATVRLHFSHPEVKEDVSENKKSPSPVRAVSSEAHSGRYGLTEEDAFAEPEIDSPRMLTPYPIFEVTDDEPATSFHDDDDDEDVKMAGGYTPSSSEIRAIDSYVPVDYDEHEMSEAKEAWKDLGDDDNGNYDWITKSMLAQSKDMRERVEERPWRTSLVEIHEGVSPVTEVQIQEIREDIEELKTFKKKARKKIESNNIDLDGRVGFINEEVKNLKYVQGVLQDHLGKVQQFQVQQQETNDASGEMKITLDKTSNLTDVVMGEVQELRGEVSAGKGELSDLCADFRNYVKEIEKEILEQLRVIEVAQKLALASIETNVKDLKRKRSFSSAPEASTSDAVPESSNKRVRLSLDISVPSAGGLIAGAVAGGLAAWMGLSFL